MLPDLPQDWLAMERWQGLPQYSMALLLILGTLISEDLACVAAGLLAADGRLPLSLGIAACASGIWFGDVALFLAGRAVSNGLLNAAWLTRLTSPERLAGARQYFAEHGTAFVFFSRFLPGVRLPGYVAAGLLRYPVYKFLLISSVAALVWTPLVCFLAMRAGASVTQWLRDWRLWLVLPVGYLAVVALGKLVQNLINWRGRRLLYGRWLRLARWEFWPAWAYYLPLLPYLLALAARYRSLTLITLCNPAMRHGGLAMESKSEILSGLQAANSGGGCIPAWVLVPCAELPERMRMLMDFMSASGLNFPIVLKPDVGERGQGVAIVRQTEDAAAYLDACRQPVIAQRYVGGLEFGVFYSRLPGEARGEIISMACKTPLSLRGDGRSSLERLILNDARAVAMAPYFLTKFAGDLATVPAAGAEVKLTELGTHCRGAVFTDARSLVTEELTAAVDRLSASYTGFHHGRYDLRVPSEEDLKEGRALQVLELNGVSSEPVHIYQPGYPLWRAWLDTCHTWCRAFAAGAAARDAGHKPPSLPELWHEVRSHRRHDWFEADRLALSKPASETHATAQAQLSN